MTSAKPVFVLILSQLLVTVALLGFAFSVHDSQEMRALIIGAVITHWLKENNTLAKEVKDTREAITQQQQTQNTQTQTEGG